MKAKVILLAALFSLATLTSFADEKPKSQKSSDSKTTTKQVINIQSYDKDLVILRAVKPDYSEAQRFNLRVVSDEGKTVFTGAYERKDDLGVPFDLSELPAGTYTFVAYKGFKTLYTKEVVKK